MTFVKDVVLVEQRDAVVFLTINRPEKLNALDGAVISALGETLDRIERDASARAVVITGAGEKAFVAGADIEFLASLDMPEAYEYMLAGQKAFMRIWEFPKPTIAMVNGYALGGGFELALACDMITASENASFGFPEINLNTMPGWGGTQLAAMKMGPNRAKEMILTGKHYPAATCREFGFINRLVRADELQAATFELAALLASKTPFAARMAKNAVNNAMAIELASGLRYEALAYTVNFNTAEARAGFAAFLDKARKR